MHPMFATLQTDAVSSEKYYTQLMVDHSPSSNPLFLRAISRIRNEMDKELLE